MALEFDPRRVFHWGYVVSNMDRAIKTWVASGGQLVVPAAIDPIQNVSCSLLVLEGALSIELVAPLPEGPNPVEARLRKGGGLDHVCLFSDDIDADVARYRDQGHNVVVEPCYGAVFDRQLAFIAMRTGLVLELMTYKPVGRHQCDPLKNFPGIAL